MDTTKQGAEECSTGALVLYIPNTLQLKKHVQKLSTISELVIESRVVNDDEAYCASVFGIDISPRSVRCMAAISHFTKIVTRSEDEPPLTLDLSPNNYLEHTT